MNISGTFTSLKPQSLLRQLSRSSDSTCLQAWSNSVSWLIYLEQGQIIYATHSVEPFDRLECHLRCLSPDNTSPSSEIRVQLRLMFEPDLQTQVAEPQNYMRNQPPEYRAIHWLVSQQHLQSTQAAVLIQELVKEVIESFLLIAEGTYDLTNPLKKMPKICKLDGEKILECCQLRLQSWQSLAPQISSPYQRPYLLSATGLDTNLTSWMKGFSLRHLAVILHQDEVQLAQTLYNYLLRGSIILHEPDPPFDQLPKTHWPEIQVPQLTTADNIEEPPHKVAPATVTAKKVYKIVSVDDSPTILKEISRFLEDEIFAVVSINEPIKAVMSIIRHKPDLILLDLNMAGIDGYELCRIVRNNSNFKDTPIIFVTGKKGIVDKVKARLVGASGYLTKPFTRPELLKIIFTHLV